MAEAHRAAQSPKIDGRLDDWTGRCPIPLIGRNQLAFQADTYEWSPDNLSGVGYLMWDATSLYVAFRVRDDFHRPIGANNPSGEAIIGGDSLILGLHPARGGDPSQAFVYYLSSASPGGGSGVHTLFRPAEHAGGRTPGHLFRDSSIYEMAVNVEKGVCIYELRIPLSELALSPVLGTRFGLTAALTDNDGAAEPVARMTWGGGIEPSWIPDQFGVVTLVE